MGQWSMHIEGHGIHDNGRIDDADAMLKEFVASLGVHHEVSAATFTVGAARSMLADDQAVSGAHAAPAEPKHGEDLDVAGNPSLVTGTYTEHSTMTSAGPASTTTEAGYVSELPDAATHHPAQ